MRSIFSRGKKYSRSGSMQLSINAIVILVMAMAVLGIGLGLIRGVLSSGKDKLTDALEGMDLSEQATSEKVIANINNLELSRNKENTVAVSFYNAETSACAATGAILDIDCNVPNEEDCQSENSCMWSEPPVTLSVEVNEGEAKIVGGIFKTGVPAGNYACKIKILCGDAEPYQTAASESAFIKVKS